MGEGLHVEAVAGQCVSLGQELEYAVGAYVGFMYVGGAAPTGAPL